MSCCDLGLQGSNPNVACNTLSQNGDHSCKIVFDVKSQSYGPEIILLKGHTVTLTFKVATQMLCATRRLNMVIIYMKFLNRTSNNEVMGRTRLCWKVMLWTWPSKSDPNVAHDMMSQYDDHLWFFFCKIWLQMTKLWAGNDFAARSCCDLHLQSSDPNVVHDTSSQYGDLFCEIVSKSDLK